MRDSRDLPDRSLERRGEIMEALKRLARITNWTQSCLALGVARASAYCFFRRKDSPAPRRETPKPERALSDDERRQVLDVLNSERFRDMPPAEVYATLLDEGVYLCSIARCIAYLKQIRRCVNGETRRVMSNTPSLSFLQRSRTSFGGGI